MSDEPNIIEQLLAEGAALAGDPDPEREHVKCPDCRTPQVAITPHGEDMQLLAIRHDDGCPWFAALPEELRHVHADELVIVHVGASETGG